MAKYKWAELKRQYIVGAYKSLREFSEDKKVPYVLLRQNAKGWVQEKRTKTEQKNNRITDRTIDNQVNAEAEYNRKHLDSWSKVNNFIELIFSDIQNLYYAGAVDDKRLKNLADILDKVQKGQRLALGLDKDKDGSTAKDAALLLAEAIEKAGKNG